MTFLRLTKLVNAKPVNPILVHICIIFANSVEAKNKNAFIESPYA